MKLSSLKHSIARKLLTIVFSLYTIVTVSLTGLHMYLDYQNANQRIREELRFYASMIAPSLAESLWNFSTDAVQSVIQGVTKSPSVVGVQVHSERSDIWRAGFAQDQEKMVYFDPKTGQLEAEKIFQASAFDYVEPIMFSDESGASYRVGELRLYSSSSIVFNQVKEAFIIILVNAVIKIIALWALFLIYGYKLLTKPLTALTEATQKVRQGEFDIAPLNTVSSWPTEIEILNDNFNVMTTDLKQAQQNLVAAKMRVKSIIDSMPSMIVGLNNEGMISDWNAQITTFTQKQEDSVSGQSFLSILPDYQFIAPTLEQVKTTQQMAFLPKQTVYIANKRYYQDILIYPLHYQNHPGLVIRIDDISAQIQLEQAIVQKEKLSSVGALAAGMAHQMTSPIGALSQHLQNIQRRLDPAIAGNQEVAQELKLSLEDLRNYLEKRKILGFIDQMDEQVQQLQKMIENIITFSQPSSAIKAQLSCQDMLNHVLELARSDYDLTKKMGFKDIAVNVIAPQEPLMIYGSKVEIEQAILGVVKFSAAQMQYANYAKNLEIMIEDKNGEIFLTLKDNSNPLSPELIEQIFDPLYTQKIAGESLSTGLSVVHQIITQSHQGKITVSADPQAKGMIYTIILKKSTLSS